jgi:hypothetical protein
MPCADLWESWICDVKTRREQGAGKDSSAAGLLSMGRLPLFDLVGSLLQQLFGMVVLLRLSFPFVKRPLSART